MLRSKSGVEVHSERHKIPADGESSTKICIRFDETPTESEVELRLLKLGSFKRDEILREASFPVENGEVNLIIYAPTRPGTGFLKGKGFKQRFDYTPINFTQSLVYEWVPTVLLAVLFAVVIRTYILASFFIPSGSMENTLLKGDLLIADKFSYHVLRQTPDRGDVMIFRYPENPKEDYIKRVIGLPGETIEVADGIVYVDGEPLEEDYIAEQPLRNFSTEGPIPDDHFFVMGDNRNHSSDSRSWGYVPRSNLEGKAVLVFWPIERVHLIDNHDPLGMTAVAAEE